MADKAQMRELLYQALETELGGVAVYERAIQCAVNEDLREEWVEYLAQTRNHVRILEQLFAKLDIDPQGKTPGREVVGHIGDSLVEAMDLAQRNADPTGAELVAAECVVLAETKDHQNWSLIGMLAASLDDKEGQALQAAYAEVENEEDKHLYHTAGWTRELWVDSLGLPAQLPPPEEEMDVKTAIGAARAKSQRQPSTQAKKR
jgi:hypothetical protein